MIIILNSSLTVGTDNCYNLKKEYIVVKIYRIKEWDNNIIESNGFIPRFVYSLFLILIHVFHLHHKNNNCTHERNTYMQLSCIRLDVVTTSGRCLWWPGWERVAGRPRASGPPAVGLTILLGTRCLWRLWYTYRYTSMFSHTYIALREVCRRN